MVNNKGQIPWNKGITIDRNKYPNYGHFKRHSEETRKLISIKVQPSIQRRKVTISNTLKRRYKNKELIHPMLGKKHSKESIEKMRNTRLRLMSEGKVKSIFKKGHDYNGKRDEVREKIKNKLEEYYINNHPWNYIDGKSNADYPSLYGSSWSKIRRRVLERDNYCCQSCNMKKRLDIHHIIPLRISHNNGINNLIALCRSCHIKMERGLL